MLKTMSRNFGPAFGFLRATGLIVALMAPSLSLASGKTIYDETADAHADVRAALGQATREHKRVILDFGGNWCAECQVLDVYLHDLPNLGLLNNNYVLVHVDVGHLDKNMDIAKKYGVLSSKGVPALAVLDHSGRILYSQKNGEFEDVVRSNNEPSVTEFLNRWKPPASR